MPSVLHRRLQSEVGGGGGGGVPSEGSGALVSKPNVVTRQAPTVKARRWKQRPRRDGCPGGPNYTEGRIHCRLETTESYPCYCIKDIESLKDR